MHRIFKSQGWLHACRNSTRVVISQLALTSHHQASRRTIINCTRYSANNLIVASSSVLILVSLRKKMSQQDDYRDSRDVPSLRKYNTFEASSSSSLRISVQKARDTYVHKSLLEKAEEAQYWKISDVVTLNELATWPEYADDLDCRPQSSKKMKPQVKENLNEKIILWQGDITKLEVDAIVNAANNSLMGGSGVDGAIHRSAGSRLVQECKTLAGCETGDAKITCGYLLPSRYVIHTVGPMINSFLKSFGSNEVPEEKEARLRSCYHTCLQRVLEHNICNRPPRNVSKSKMDDKKEEAASDDSQEQVDKGGSTETGEEPREGKEGESLIDRKLKRLEPQIRSVAFPCISTGVYGYPNDAAAHVGLKTVREWLEEHPLQVDYVVFCVFLGKDLELYEKLLPLYFPLQGAPPQRASEEET